MGIRYQNIVSSLRRSSGPLLVAPLPSLELGRVAAKRIVEVRRETYPQQPSLSGGKSKAEKYHGVEGAAVEGCSGGSLCRLDLADDSVNTDWPCVYSDVTGPMYRSGGSRACSSLVQ